MKKQYIVIISSVLLVLLFVVGVQIYKGQQNKKYGLASLCIGGGEALSLVIERL